MNTDINYIIQMAINGDKNYQGILLEKLKPLIYKNIYKFWRAMDPITEDLAQEGYILILESLNTFDYKRNVHFLHYIKTKLLYFYMNYYRNTKNPKYAISYLETNCYETIKSSLDLLVEKEKLNFLLNIFNFLSETEQKILTLFYYEKQSISEIADELNITYRACLGRKQRAVKKLRKLTDEWR